MLTVFLLGSVALSDPPADDLLAGPTIEEEEVTSQDMTDRVLKEQGKSNKVGSRKQSRMWMTTLKVIDLTKDQEIEIHKIMAEYQKMNQIFQATHGEEIRSIREEHGKQGRDVLTTILIGAPKDQAAVPEASKKRMLELMELAPDVTKYQERAWVFLSENQQAVFATKYQELLDEEMSRREGMKRGDRPKKDDRESRGFAPSDQMFGDRDMQDGDITDRDKDSLDEMSLRRIKFLRRLQQLENENK